MRERWKLGKKTAEPFGPPTYLFKTGQAFFIKTSLLIVFHYRSHGRILCKKNLKSVYTEKTRAYETQRNRRGMNTLDKNNIVRFLKKKDTTNSFQRALLGRLLKNQICHL